MSKLPLISIVVPVYNADQYLLETVKSIQDQSYLNWKLILVDDKSTDNSRAVIEDIAAKDDRIVPIYLSKNVGVALARNMGVDASKGADYLAFLDADDLWLPNKLERQLSLANSSKNAALFYSGYEFADATAKPSGVRVEVPVSMSLKEAYGNHLIWTSTVLIDLSRVEESDIKMLDIDFGEDITTWWRILSRYGRAQGINEPLALYRRRSRSLSSNKLSILRKKWSVFSYANDLRMNEKVYYYFLSLYNATRKRI